MTALRRALLGFLAAVLSVLIFHQGMVALLYVVGAISSAPYAITPVGPFAVPRIIDLCFWGGVYGILFGIALPSLPRRPMWLKGLLLGLIAAVVGWFVVAPLKGLPVAAGWSPNAMMMSVLINGAWGIGVGIFWKLSLSLVSSGAATNKGLRNKS
jgi:hypothetical protein